VTLWILDTDHFSLFQRGYPQVRRRVNAIPSEDIAITIVTTEEQFYGRLNRIRRAESADQVISAYRQLRETLEDFKTINLVDFGLDASNCYAELLRQKIRIGTQDLRIAATVISQNAFLVTRNRRDFERVPGLNFEDWTIEESGGG
jgi:tRNA(fMet)-specific endonuclease VapC